jgi:uncharacterized protein
MRAQLSPSKLSATWDKVTAQSGALLAAGETHAWSNGARCVVSIESAFEHGTFDVTVTFDALGRIAGLWFGSLRPTWAAPPYVETHAFAERDLDVGRSPKLSATLTEPTGTGPFPVVVLVHGSGPSDRDETSGGNKLFKDLAWGLGSRGIAVLRYNKRTYQYPRSLAGKAITYDEEVVDDACAVVRDAATLPGIEPTRVFVLGHSLGADLAPHIALRAGLPVAGVVLMAGSTRPVDRLTRDQTRYLLGLRHVAPDKIEEAVRAVDAAYAKAQEVGPSEEIIAISGASLPRSYIRGELAYDSRRAALALPSPMLVLQGERDYQVTAADDYEGFRRALAGRSNVSFQLYPGLNHRFVAGEGPSTPEEYEKLGHADARVISDVATWLTMGRLPL